MAKLNKMTCIICRSSKGSNSKPIFASEEDLKKHYLLGHNWLFLKRDLESGSEQAKRPKVSCFPAQCVFCTHTMLVNWEQAVLHVGIDHGKLFYALKHFPKHDFKPLMKRFFPDKYKTDQKRKSTNKISLPTEDSNQADQQMDRFDGDMRSGSIGKLERLHDSGQKVRHLSNLSEAAQEEPRSCEKNNGESVDHRRSLDVDSREESRTIEDTTRKLKRTRKEVDKDQAEPRTGFICSICPPSDLVGSPSKYSSEEALHGHMADSHFFQWIRKQNLMEEGSTICRLTLYPLLYSSCTLLPCKYV